MCDLESGFVGLGWEMPQASLVLHGGEVHLWSVPLNGVSVAGAEYCRWLAPHECERATSFRNSLEKQRFVRAHVALRAILATYCSCHPAQISFGYNAFGKPHLDASAHRWLRFSIAHSADQLLCAVAKNREVGVDLERIDTAIPIDELARSFFTQREQTILQSLPLLQRQRTFFAYWTRKEAVVKAHGMGLSIPLDSFEVDPANGHGPQLLSIRDSGTPAHCWSLHDIEYLPEFAAAIAVEGEHSIIRPLMWSWERLGSYLS